MNAMPSLTANREESLLTFLRVLVNADRLRLIGLLIDHEYSSQELVQLLGWKEPELLDHIASLRSLDLVKVRTADAKSRYTLNHTALHSINRTILSRSAQPSPIDDYPHEAERRALKPFFDGERVTLPASPKVFQMLINWLITCFEVGVKYTEKEVNEIIKRYNEDYATLRRGMIDANLMQRENGVYWRIG